MLTRPFIHEIHLFLIIAIPFLTVVNKIPSTRATFFGLLVIILIVIFLFLIPNFAYGGYGEINDEEIVDTLTESIESGIHSIEVPADNPLETTQEEVDDFGTAVSQWLESFVNFGKKTHRMTESGMALAAPSWFDALWIALIAGALVAFIMYRFAKKIGWHFVFAIAIIVTIVVFLILLDIYS